MNDFEITYFDGKIIVKILINASDKDLVTLEKRINIIANQYGVFDIIIKNFSNNINVDYLNDIICRFKIKYNRTILIENT